MMQQNGMRQIELISDPENDIEITWQICLYEQEYITNMLTDMVSAEGNAMSPTI